MSFEQEFIQQIQRRILSSDQEFALDGYAGSIDRLQKAFPRYGSFIMEFIQNADDAHSQKMKIELSSQAMSISNDGHVFCDADVKSICKVGRSSKTAKESIGYLGVGFKAVFLISKKPEIYSGPWKFKFDQDHWKNTKLPWQIIPIWNENSSIFLQDGFTTSFCLPLHHSKNLSIELQPEYLHQRILLFLNNLREMEIVDHDQGLNRKIVRTNILAAKEYEIVELCEYNHQSRSLHDQWLVFRSLCSVPLIVRNDPLTVEWERNNIETREVAVAFKLNSAGHLLREERGTAHIGVFSFLPLKEIPSGLNFLIQADFLTMTGRGELARECLWNNWLTEQLYELITQKIIPIFKDHPVWKLNFVEILYSSPGGHPLFENYLKEPLRKFLSTQAVVAAEDGSFLRLDETVTIDQQMRELLPEEDFQKLFPGKKAMHDCCCLPEELKNKIPHSAVFTPLGISDKILELLQSKASSEEVSFFKLFYNLLCSSLRSDPALILKVKAQPFLWAEDGSLTDSYSAYLKPGSQVIPAEIKGNFRLVHPQLCASPELYGFLQGLGISELSEESIQEIAKKKELTYLGQHWEILSENEKIAKIKLCFSLWQKEPAITAGFAFMTLPAKNGEWLEPAELFLPQAYTPAHSIELLLQQKVLDFPLPLLSAVFVENAEKASGQEITNWRQFVCSLGVDKKLSERSFKKNIIQRIGIMVALKYEQTKERQAVEIPRSKEVFGYDIAIEEEVENIGFVQSSERYIEVKSSEKPYPDIFLTSRQFQTLQEKKEKYYVYVVTDVLRNPVLHVTRGDKLLAVTQIKTLIPFRKWWQYAKEEEFRGMK